MRILLALVVAFGLLVATVDYGQEKKVEPESVADWRKDPVCRAVYAGVLEGLYRDAVSDKIVANIIGKKTSRKDKKTMRERMKRSFVLDCPLCEPTFEAFLTYQNRKAESLGGGRELAQKTLPGLGAQWKKALLSDATRQRLEGLSVLVERWVRVKLDSSSEIKPAEIQAWKNRVHQRSTKGKGKLISLIQDGNDYKQWSAYWGCAACNGSTLAAEAWKIKP